MQATLEAIKASNVVGRWATDAKGTEEPSGGIRKSSIATNDAAQSPNGWRLSRSSGVTFISGTSS